MVEDQSQLFNKFKEESAKHKYSIVPISCVTKENIDTLLEVIGELSSHVMDKNIYTLSYPSVEHNERYSWLIKNAKIS